MQSRGRVVLWAAAALIGAAHSTSAQIVREPETVRACLCREQSVAALNDRVQGEHRAYEDKRQSFEALDKQVQASRQQVNVKNQTEVDAFKRLLEQRDAAADALAGSATQSYADAVETYNRAVGDYNSNCAGKTFDPEQMKEMRQGLVCPRP
jgi:hypothetical protein